MLVAKHIVIFLDKGGITSPIVFIAIMFKFLVILFNVHETM